MSQERSEERSEEHKLADLVYESLMSQGIQPQVAQWLTDMHLRVNRLEQACGEQIRNWQAMNSNASKQ